MEQTDLRYLKSLAKQYPTVAAAATEIINLQSILSLPKGTEHFITDIHGEYDQFQHVLKNGSGAIKRKIEDEFGNAISQAEKKSIATLIYYPEQKMEQVIKTEENMEDWYKVTLYRLIRICKGASSKYTRSKVRKALPKDFAYVIEELLTGRPDVSDQEAYYNEIMGMDFQMSMDFIHVSLRKWLPRMNEFQRQNVAASIYDSLDSLRKAGKTENMLRNAYIKFMCWLYYKFERIVNQLGENHIPKILYEGQISNYELMLISILSNAGCDVVLLQYAGDQGYLKTDPGSVLSDSLQMEDLQPFPQGYCVKKVRDEIQNELNNERLYGIRPSLTNCTNAWIKGNGLDDIRESILLRGNDSRFFYNCFCRINGAEDKLTYANELFRLQQELRNSKRNTVIVSKEIPRPTPQEISEIKRSNYTSEDQMLLGLACNIQYGANPELQRILHKTFVDVMLAESQKEGENLNRLTNRAVYLLCWMRRYLPKLFINWKSPGIGWFI